MSMLIEEAIEKKLCRNCHNWNDEISDCTLDLVCEKARYCEQCKKDLPKDFNLIRIGSRALELCKQCFDNGEGFFVCDNCGEYAFDEEMECFGAENWCQECKIRYMDRMSEKYGDIESLTEAIQEDISMTREKPHTNNRKILWIALVIINVILFITSLVM